MSPARKSCFLCKYCVIVYKKEGPTMGLLRFHTNPLHLLPDRDTAGRCLHGNATALIGERKPPVGSAALDFFPPSW